MTRKERDNEIKAVKRAYVKGEITAHELRDKLIVLLKHLIVEMD